MSTLLRTSKLIENCTSSISYDAQVKAASEAFDAQMYEIIDDTGQVIMIPSIMHLTDPKLIDALAWQFHVDFYDPTRDLEFRKRLVQMSIVWHKTKGTVALVREVIDTYWPGSAYLEEWFNYNPNPPGQPPTGWSGPLPEPSWHDRYRFRIILNDAIVDPVIEAQVLTLIKRYKPVSRWPEAGAVVRPRTSIGNIYVAAYAMFFITRVSVQQPPRTAGQLVTTGIPGNENELVTGDDGLNVTVGGDTPPPPPT